MEHTEGESYKEREGGGKQHGCNCDNDPVLGSVCLADGNIRVCLNWENLFQSGGIPVQRSCYWCLYCLWRTAMPPPGAGAGGQKSIKQETATSSSGSTGVEASRQMSFRKNFALSAYIMHGTELLTSV